MAHAFHLPWPQFLIVVPTIPLPDINLAPALSKTHKTHAHGVMISVYSPKLAESSRLLALEISYIVTNITYWASSICVIKRDKSQTGILFWLTLKKFSAYGDTVYPRAEGEK